MLDVLAKIDTHVARQDDILATQTAILARMDERLANQDAILRQMDVHLAKLGEFMASCHHEAAAAHQTAAVALQRFAEVSLGVDRFVALAERLLADRK